MKQIGSGGPGKSFREGISLIELFGLFPDNDTAECWLEDVRWDENGPMCPRCDKCDAVREVKSRKPMKWWCNTCRRNFSVRSGTVLAHSKIPLQKWVVGIYLQASSLKGVSSMKLHRDLKITQKSAWFMAHRLREAMASEAGLFGGPVEVDETFIGGLEKNKHASKKQHAGRGTVGKTAVAGMKDRETGQIKAQVVEDTSGPTLKQFVYDNTEWSATVYTDEHGAYRGMMDVEHETVNHSVSAYVNGMAHTNGLESFWSMLKRGYHGTYHHMSPKHLHRYVKEFAGRHNLRDSDTIDQMRMIAAAAIGKRLMYRELVGQAK